MKVAIYVRVSTDKQEVDNQLLELRPFVEKQDWHIQKEYVDIISGKEESRPAFDDMFQNAHKRLFDVVVFWDLSRFSRAGTTHTLLKLKELEGQRIEWISYQEPYIRSIGPFRDVVISVFATVAKMEREKISKRTKAGLERAKKQGKKLGRRYRQIDFSRVWREYETQGSINKAAKVLPYSKGVVHRIIKERIQTQEEYERK